MSPWLVSCSGFSLFVLILPCISERQAEPILASYDPSNTSGILSCVAEAILGDLF